MSGKSKKHTHGAFGRCKWGKISERLRIANEMLEKRRAGPRNPIARLLGKKK